MSQMSTGQVVVSTEIDDASLAQARMQAINTGQTLVAVLALQMQMGQRDAARMLASRFSYPFWESHELYAAIPVFGRWSLARAQNLRSVLVEMTNHETLTASLNSPKERHLYAVICDPYDTDLITQLEQAAQQLVIFVDRKSVV